MLPIKKTNDFLFGSPLVSENNLLGHRSKNLDELDLNNYILFSGCSHTWGVGLEKEETYPYLVAKQLQCDYYNLAISGGGIELAVVNIFSFLHNIKPNPKVLILQYPGPYRFLIRAAGDNKVFYNVGPWVKKTAESEILVDFHKNRYIHAKYIIWEHLVKCINIPMVLVSHENMIDELKSMDIKNFLTIRNLDVAKDNIHPGIQSNIEIANLIVEHIEKVYF